MADGTRPRLLVLLVVLLAGCSASTPPSPGTSASPGPPAHATVTQGAFQLTFELPRTTYRAGETIEGLATLGAVGGAPVAFGSSGGGPFVFNIAEVGGSRHVEGVMTADCAAYRLEPGQPMTSPIIKSGATYDEDPEAPFVGAYLSSPTVSLPAGDWRITAEASLVEGAACTGASRRLDAPIVIHVTP